MDKEERIEKHTKQLHSTAFLVRYGAAKELEDLNFENVSMNDKLYSLFLLRRFATLIKMGEMGIKEMVRGLVEIRDGEEHIVRQIAESLDKYGLEKLEMQARVYCWAVLNRKEEATILGEKVIPILFDLVLHPRSSNIPDMHQTAFNIMVRITYVVGLNKMEEIMKEYIGKQKKKDRKPKKMGNLLILLGAVFRKTNTKNEGILSEGKPKTPVGKRKMSRTVRRCMTI